MKADPDAYEDEKPRHKVTHSRSRFTWAKPRDRRAVQVLCRCHRLQDRRGDGRAPPRKDVEEPRIPDNSFVQTDDHPVVCVSWNDADAYCEWLATRTAGCESPLAPRGRVGVESPCETTASRRRSTTSATTRQNSASMPGLMTIRKTGIVPARFTGGSRTASNFTTCTAWPGSGAGMANESTRNLRRTLLYSTRRGPPAPARSACTVAACSRRPAVLPCGGPRRLRALDPARQRRLSRAR